MDDVSAKSLVKDLPNHPGVYQMRDRFGSIIYIGKAKNIKKRVSQYFVGNDNTKPICWLKKLHPLPHYYKNRARGIAA